MEPVLKDACISLGDKTIFYSSVSSYEVREEMCDVYPEYDGRTGCLLFLGIVFMGAVFSLDTYLSGEMIALVVIVYIATLFAYQSARKKAKPSQVPVYTMILKTTSNKADMVVQTRNVDLIDQIKEAIEQGKLSSL